MLQVYRRLLRLYPAEHRQQFNEEMLAVLVEERDEHAAHVSRISSFVAWSPF